MISEVTAGWEKKASAAPVAPKQDVERAFADQCYMLVANAAGPLMDEKFRLGFEMVNANPDKTRMLGIFAFRVGKEILYAPVFFDNGEVHGGDLIYRHTTKRFLPLTASISRFLVSLFRAGEGRSVAPSHAMKQPQGIRTQQIAFPPTLHKRASIPDGLIAEMLEQRALAKDVLAEYLDDVGSVGLEKLASLCEKSEKFASRVDRLIPRALVSETREFALDQLRGELSELYPDTDTQLLTKLATALQLGDDETAGQLAREAQEDYLLTLHTGLTAAVKSAAKGTPSPFVLEDKREGLTPPIITEDVRLESLRTGVFVIHDAEGKRRKVVVAEDQEFVRGGGYSCVPCSNSGGFTPRAYQLVTDDGQLARVTGADKYLVEPVDEPPTTLSEAGVAKPSEGKFYVALDTDRGVIDATVFRVSAVTKELPHRVTLDFAEEARPNRWSSPRTILLNPDVSRSTQDSWGANIRFLEVKRQKLDDSDCCGGSAFEAEAFSVPANADIDSILRLNGYKKASLRADKNIGTSRLWVDGRHREGTKMAMAVYLSRDMRLPADAALELLERETVDFHFHAGEKSAYATRVVDSPDFQVNQDPTFGIDFMAPQSFNLRTSKYTPTLPPDHAGDHANLNPAVKNIEHLPEEVIESASSDELGALAEGMGLPHTFDHGAVAALASAHNSMKVVAKYLAKTEEGLDALCRILFLARWKPEDFKKAYGDDDFPEHVSELESLVEQLGEFWCKMQARAPSKDPEHAPLNL